MSEGSGQTVTGENPDHSHEIKAFIESLCHRHGYTLMQLVEETVESKASTWKMGYFSLPLKNLFTELEVERHAKEVFGKNDIEYDKGNRLLIKYEHYAAFRQAVVDAAFAPREPVAQKRQNLPPRKEINTSLFANLEKLLRKGNEGRDNFLHELRDPLAITDVTEISEDVSIGETTITTYSEQHDNMRPADPRAATPQSYRVEDYIADTLSKITTVRRLPGKNTPRAELMDAVDILQGLLAAHRDRLEGKVNSDNESVRREFTPLQPGFEWLNKVIAALDGHKLLDELSAFNVQSQQGDRLHG
ncbi:MAG: hypothetical protein KGJ06_04285 [Pseudomonadota bacterium]|nr:hypothetical protein [Pseudomonadota bacterium]